MKNKKLVILIEIALTVAIALILSKIRIWKMPQGGSITLEVLPLAFFAYRRGFSRALFSGLLYGLVSLMFMENPIVHFFQPFFDYIFPALSIAICGLGKDKDLYVKEFLLFFAFIFKFLFHFTSGVIFFGHYAPKGQSAYIYSAIYNISYIGPAAVAVMILIYVFDRKKLFK
ncbi:MAG: energy-coupled thiamine transporter ThiT [Candidatus Muiribacteriota bacterium]